MKKLLIIICSIPGVGLLTAVTVLAETNGFDLIRNKKQLTSYAGLDVREKQSGTSVKGKPKISKKGNRY
ncbi:MAG: IS110 family transposase [Chitinophagaceae bacterium]